uniref:Uncharacterized protein n=1 Tax=Knipowitschia caucasica TaxID=637954 RepID=A0AAV2J4V5_KNICA
MALAVPGPHYLPARFIPGEHGSEPRNESRAGFCSSDSAVAQKLCRHKRQYGGTQAPGGDSLEMSPSPPHSSTLSSAYHLSLVTPHYCQTPLLLRL